MELSGASIAIVGRFASAPRWRLAGELARRGAALTRQPAEARGIVVGYGAQTRFAALIATLADAERRGAWSASERQFLRALGLAGPPPAGPRSLSGEDLAGVAGLHGDEIRLLALFDVIDAHDDGFSFRDLVAARQVRRLLDGGTALAEIIAAVVAVQRRHHDDLLSRMRLTRLADGELARAIGDYLADLDGQLRLPLGDAGNPSLDLLFDDASVAEEEQRWGDAEAIYRRIIGIAPDDEVGHFNFANLLSAHGRDIEAELSLRRAVAAAPGFAEAWYNLAHLLESKGDVTAARRCLERAVDADGRFADALYNLARLCLVAGEPAQAAPLYERYLALDPNSRWAARAQQALRLCRLLRAAEPERS